MWGGGFTVNWGLCLEPFCLPTQSCPLFLSFTLPPSFSLCSLLLFLLYFLLSTHIFSSPLSPFLSSLLFSCPVLSSPLLSPLLSSPLPSLLSYALLSLLSSPC